MPHYKLLSSTGEPLGECEGTDASSALFLASQINGKLVEVYENEKYVFSLRGGGERLLGRHAKETKKAQATPR